MEEVAEILDPGALQGPRRARGPRLCVQVVGSAGLAKAAATGAFSFGFEAVSSSPVSSFSVLLDRSLSSCPFPQYLPASICPPGGLPPSRDRHVNPRILPTPAAGRHPALQRRRPRMRSCRCTCAGGRGLGRALHPASTAKLGPGPGLQW